MVKNTNGGSKAKGFARKHANSNNNNNNNDVRVVEEEGEVYAVVTKMCGGGMFQCYGIDHIERLCHIRGSFSGRKKRDNIVVNGGWVLIGLREWDKKDEEKQSTTTTTSKKVKLPQCDLLEVYNDKDREKLLATVKENWKVLIKHDPTRIGFDEDEDVIAFGKTEDDDNFGFKFATAAEIERDELMQLVKSSATEKVKMYDDDVPDEQAELMVSIDEL